MIEYSSKIEISGSGSDEDQYLRTQRIHRVLGYAQALADIDNHEDFNKKIISIYDHKGILTLKWKEQPTDKEKEYLQNAWESIVTDYESETIEHIISVMKTKKYSITIVEYLNAGKYYNQTPVNDLSDLIKQLEQLGIITFDIENSTPYDDLPNIIKSNLSIYDVTESDFDLLAKTTEFKPRIVPVKVRN